MDLEWGGVFEFFPSGEGAFDSAEEGVPNDGSHEWAGEDAEGEDPDCEGGVLPVEEESGEDDNRINEKEKQEGEEEVGGST